MYERERWTKKSVESEEEGEGIKAGLVRGAGLSQKAVPRELTGAEGNSSPKCGLSFVGH